MSTKHAIILNVTYAELKAALGLPADAEIVGLVQEPEHIICGVVGLIVEHPDAREASMGAPVGTIPIGDFDEFLERQREWRLSENLTW